MSVRVYSIGVHLIDVYTLYGYCFQNREYAEHVSLTHTHSTLTHARTHPPTYTNTHILLQHTVIYIPVVVDYPLTVFVYY